MLRWVAAIVVLAGISAGALFFAAGRSTPPLLTIDHPDRPVGQKGTLEVSATAPGARFTSLDVTVEQNGKTTALFSLESADSSATVRSDGDRMIVTRPFGKQSVPELQAGAARIVVSAVRPSFLGLRALAASTTKDVAIKLDPPSLAVLSTHHYINHGGAELVVYRASPADVESGVRVGTVEYRGYPASGAGVAGADPSMRVAFFALEHDQDLSTPIAVFARDAAGNEATTSVIDSVFPKPFRRSRIQIDQRFLGRVVPEILARSPELTVPAGNDLLASFLVINGDLRRRNADTISTVMADTASTRLWSGPFVQLGNSKVEAGFADHRTYVHDGKDVDQQVHLGFDLAVTAAIPVVAANAGKVLHASWLGIYGNCVIVDHGMGIGSLYGHLSATDVKPGDTVTRGQVLGRSGMTGLAGGDHLHFTMLVQGHAVNPVEWWDGHWIADRVERKLTAARGERGDAGSATPAQR